MQRVRVFKSNKTNILFSEKRTTSTYGEECEKSVPTSVVFFSPATGFH